MRIIAIFLFVVLSEGLLAAENHCGDIKRIRTWANGTDSYGVWVEYKSNPATCSGGFYLQHEATNKQFIFSMLLAAKHGSSPVCIQVYSHDADIGNRCRINYVVHE